MYLKTVWCELGEDWGKVEIHFLPASGGRPIYVSLWQAVILASGNTKNAMVRPGNLIPEVAVAMVTGRNGGNVISSTRCKGLPLSVITLQIK